MTFVNFVVEFVLTILVVLVFLFPPIVLVIPVLIIVGLVKFFNVYIRQEKNKVISNSQYEVVQTNSESPKYSPYQITKSILFIIASFIVVAGGGLFVIGLMISVFLGGDNAVTGPPLIQSSGIATLIGLFFLAGIVLAEKTNVGRNN